MTAEMNAFVDKVAEKLGEVAANALPIAQEALDQFVARETFYAWVYFSVAALFFAVGGTLIVCAWKGYTEMDEDVTGPIGFCAAAVGFLVSIGGFSAAGKALAPLAALVGI